MVDLGIITPVTEPTEWVSSLTYPHRPDGSLHICLLTHGLNKAIIREHYKAQSLEEIPHKLSGATVSFSKLDAKDGFLVSAPGHPFIISDYIQHTQSQRQISSHIIWSEDVSGCISNANVPNHQEIIRNYSNA